MMTDPIADMLTRIRNSNNAKHKSVDVPASNIKKRDCRNTSKRRLYKEL